MLACTAIALTWLDFVSQEEFEKENFVESVLAELPEDATPEERELIRKRTKSRMLGNIRFIGELYKQKMLTEKIMHECLMKLLGEVENPDEDEIECLCKLLTTIGKMIDHAKAKPHIDEYFLRMNEMAKNAALPNRMRFMLQECIDLRRGNWSVRKADPKAKSESDAERAGKGKGGIQAGNGDIRGRGAAAGRGAPGGRGAGGKIEKPKSNESGPSVAAAPPPPPKFTAEELTDKIEQTLEEYFSGAGLDELVQCARDLQPRVAEADSLSKQMVQTAMSKGFDARTDDQREKVRPTHWHLYACATPCAAASSPADCHSLRTPIPAHRSGASSVASPNRKYCHRPS